MLIKRRRGWGVPGHVASPEAVFLNRRALIGGAAGLAAGSLLGGRAALAAAGGQPLYPAPQNPAYTLDRPLPPERLSAGY
ncbi:protein-methionine-sulfoxide reductase catalytic subunit MsrP, partial [Methylobacterium sp. D54C]